MIEESQGLVGHAPIEDTRHSIDMARANLLGFPLALVTVLPLVLVHGLLWGWVAVAEAFRDFWGNFLGYLPLVIAGIVLHEGVHALTWGVCGGHGLRSVRIGFQWKTLTPFAHSKVPIAAWAYRLGAAMPGLLTGVLPSLAASLAGMPALAGFGWFMTFCAGGDLLVLLLLRGVPANALVEDHPTRAGCRLVSDATS